jgi:AcrR family transcriptional regulator
MARSETLNQQMRESSRALILETALKLFSEHGYDRTSIKMIAESAGISQGLLYNYFASKDELLEAIFAQSMSDVQASFAMADAGSTPAERIERLVRGAFAILRKNQDFWRLSYGLRMQHEVLAGLAKQTRKSTAMIRQTLTRYLRDAGAQEPELEAAILFALIDGVSQHYVLDPGKYPIDAVADRIIKRFQPTAVSVRRAKRASR